MGQGSQTGKRWGFRREVDQGARIWGRVTLTPPTPALYLSRIQRKRGSEAGVSSTADQQQSLYQKLCIDVVAVHCPRRQSFCFPGYSECTEPI